MAQSRGIGGIMKRNHIPDHVQLKLDKFERAVAHLTYQLSRTQEAIASAR
jgi:hypothetical protein